MGFPKDAFCGVITSGEVTHDNLTHRRSPFWQSRKKCIHITWGARGAISLENLGIDVTLDPSEADCIIAHGTEALGTEITGTEALPKSLEEIKSLLKACSTLSKNKQDPSSSYSIPMIVANPDVVTVHGTELRTMPGTLAKWYKDLGGEVHLMGKPASIIYQGALQMLDLPAEEVLAIGDSLEHDIAGAIGAGVSSLFVGGGIHASELGVGENSRSEEGSNMKLLNLCSQFDVQPPYYIDYFAL
jgi:ribonucleotide monophosphatase NagD (HAD superfamily)